MEALELFSSLSLWSSPFQVYLDFMLGDWLEEDRGENLTVFFRLFGGLSAAVIGLTYFYNILGQWIGRFR